MELGKSTVGAAAFLRRTGPYVEPTPNLDAGSEAPAVAETRGGEPLPAPLAPQSSPVLDSDLLVALQELEPDSRPRSTMDNLATELEIDLDDVRPMVEKLEREGFIERHGDTSLSLSDVGKRAVRYTKMARLG